MYLGAQPEKGGGGGKRLSVAQIDKSSRRNSIDVSQALGRASPPAAGTAIGRRGSRVCFATVVKALDCNHLPTSSERTRAEMSERLQIESDDELLDATYEEAPNSDLAADVLHGAAVVKAPSKNRLPMALVEERCSSNESSSFGTVSSDGAAESPNRREVVVLAAGASSRPEPEPLQQGGAAETARSGGVEPILLTRSQTREQEGDSTSSFASSPLSSQQESPAAGSDEETSPPQKGRSLPSVLYRSASAGDIRNRGSFDQTLLSKAQRPSLKILPDGMNISRKEHGTGAHQRRGSLQRGRKSVINLGAVVEFSRFSFDQLEIRE
eukprot:g18203.t1